MGLGGAFQPSWSADSQWLAFGVGYWFQQRDTEKSTIMRIRRDGSGLESLTDGQTPMSRRTVGWPARERIKHSLRDQLDLLVPLNGRTA